MLRVDPENKTREKANMTTLNNLPEERQQQDFNNTVKDRRRTNRANVDWDLEVDVEGENVVYTGLIKDISTGGVFIATREPLPTGTVMSLRFSFPNLPEAVRVNSRVQWVRDHFSESSRATGMGVQFLDLPEHIRARMNEYIADKSVLMYEEGF